MHPFKDPIEIITYFLFTGVFNFHGNAFDDGFICLPFQLQAHIAGKGYMHLKRISRFLLYLRTHLVCQVTNDSATLSLVVCSSSWVSLHV